MHLEITYAVGHPNGSSMASMAVSLMGYHLFLRRQKAILFEKRR